MQHDLAHEYAQNAAIRLLAKYVRDLRAALKDRYPVGDGNPTDDVDALLTRFEQAEAASQLESVLNHPVPSPEEAKAILAQSKPPPRPGLKKGE
jgi:hypothetical protein